MSRQTQAKGISGRTRTLFKGELTTPEASKYTILLDTTNGQPNNQMAAPGRSATLPTPGTILGVALGRVYGFTVQCTGQNVSVVEYGLDGSGAWALFATTTITAAAAPQAFTWDPSAYGFEDAAVFVLAGGTAPTKVYATLTERDAP